MSLPASFDLTPEDAKLLLAANVHLGSKNVQVCPFIVRGVYQMRESRTITTKAIWGTFHRDIMSK